MILGIDSAPAKTGWALVDRKGTKEELIASGVLARVDGTVVAEFVQRVMSGPRPTMAAIEDAYLDKNVQVVKVLSRLVGRWQQELDRVGLPHRLVMGSVWQRAVLRGLIGQTTKRAERKRAAKLWVKATFRLSVTEDEADAVALATWVSRQTRFEQLVERGRC